MLFFKTIVYNRPAAHAEARAPAWQSIFGNSVTAAMIRESITRSLVCALRPIAIAPLRHQPIRFFRHLLLWRNARRAKNLHHETMNYSPRPQVFDRFGELFLRPARVRINLSTWR